MEIYVNKDLVLNFNEIKMQVLANEIPMGLLEKDIKRRVKWVITHKYENSYKRLKEEWEPKLLALGVKSIPLYPDEFAKLVFSQKEYKDRGKRQSLGDKGEDKWDNGADNADSK